MSDAASDEDLMARVAEADQVALRALMSRYARRGLALAERIVGGNVEADDVCQEAFIKVWRHAGRFDPARARFSTWFFRIVVNLAIDRTRRSARQRPLEATDEIPADVKDAMALMAEADQEKTLAAAMAQLSDRQRAAIALFHIEGMSGRDAAASMEMSEKAFESLLMRARANLKARVAKLETGG